MEMVIGPILRRAGGYAFDTWAARDGINFGYPYRRIDDAIYARKATIKAATQSSGLFPLVCQTLDEFLNRSLDSELLNAA